MALEMDPKSLWSISYGLYIVSTCHGGKRTGQICNTVIQVSSEPPRVAMALNKDNYTHELLVENGICSVSVLDEETPMRFIGGFGFRSGRDVDKFEGVEHIDGDNGCPIVTENALSVFVCKVFASLDVGTHTLFAADVVGGKVLTDGKPLTYAQYHANKGVAPKAAPTFRGPTGGEERVAEKPAAKQKEAPERKQDVKAAEKPAAKAEEQKGAKPMKKYVCQVCGYVYDPAEGDPDGGIEPGTAFEDLPEDWVCPVCGADKSQFDPED